MHTKTSIACVSTSSGTSKKKILPQKLTALDFSWLVGMSNPKPTEDNMQLELIQTVRYGDGTISEEVVDFDQQRHAIETQEAAAKMDAEWEAENPWASGADVDSLTGFAFDPHDPWANAGTLAATARMMASIDGDGEFWDEWKDQMKDKEMMGW